MDLSELKNGKYFKGKYTDSGEYRGWFCGSFIKDEHPGKTNQLEIKYAEHKQGDIEKPHYHEKMIEVLIFLDGEARFNVNGQDVFLQKGEFLFVDVNNIISGEFTKPSKIFALHTPSLPDDEIFTQKQSEGASRRLKT